MLEIENNVYETLGSCRYCLSDDNNSELFSPCRCKGSSKYVHKKCLNEWLTKKNNTIVIPGLFLQFSNSCEICHTTYKLSFKKIEESKRKLYLDLFIYISTITILLLFTYTGIGFLLEQSEKTHQLFTNKGTHLENIIYNGFIMTHIILAIFYIAMSIVFCVSGQTDCFCCFIYAGNCEGNYDTEGYCIFLVFLVIVGIFGTILLIYYDVTTRLIQRYHNKCHIVENIEPYTEE